MITVSAAAAPVQALVDKELVREDEVGVFDSSIGRPLGWFCIQLPSCIQFPVSRDTKWKKLAGSRPHVAGLQIGTQVLSFYFEGLHHDSGLRQTPNTIQGDGF